MTTVGVVVPVLNSARTLRSRVESLRTRTHRCEVVVVDDHLLDSTLCTAGPLADLVIGAGLERSAQRNCGAARQNADPVALLKRALVDRPPVRSTWASHLQPGSSACRLTKARLSSGLRHDLGAPSGRQSCRRRRVRCCIDGRRPPHGPGGILDGGRVLERFFQVGDGMSKQLISSEEHRL
jgi:hypothetical protein